MSEEDLRIQQIKMKIKGLTFEQARDINNLCSEYYIEGLEQSRFDKRMLEIQVSSREEVANKYKEVIDEVRKHCNQEIKSASIQYERDKRFKHQQYIVYHERVLQILDKVKEVK